MENKNVGLIIGVAIAILIGIALLGVIATQINSSTGLTSNTDTVNLAAARLDKGALNDTYDFVLTKALYNGWRTSYSECEVQTIEFYNQSGDLMTDPTHYVFVMDVATLSVKNVLAMNSTTSNSTTAVYQYCADGYISGWGKTVTNMIPGFFAIALLMGVVFIIVFVLKDEGVDIGA